MPRVVSFIVLVAFLLLSGAVFFQVMAPFVLPLFMAAVLVVIFKPLHLRVLERLPGRPRISALTTTTLILLIVLLPTTWLGWKAYVECGRVLSDLKDEHYRQQLGNQFNARASQLTDLYEQVFDEKLDVTAMLKQIPAYIGTKLLSGVNLLGKVLIGLFIMMVALYYFLADGPQIIETILRLSPLEPEYERELLNQFSNVSRAVVLASLVAAIAQGLLAGVGFHFAMNAGAPVFLLTALTMIFALVPFLGAAVVWFPTCAWIYVYQPHVVDGVTQYGDWVSALGLGIYGFAMVSTVDNVLKPMVLHGQSNLHPLLALLSILGGLAALGPVGILVGPMIVAFVQALLVMVNKELVLMAAETNPDKSSFALDSATLLDAEAAVARKGPGSMLEPRLAPDEAGENGSPGGALGHTTAGVNPAAPSQRPATGTSAAKRRRKRK